MRALLAMAVGIAAAAAQPAIDVTVTVDSPVIPFHRQTHFTITVEAPADTEFTLPEMTQKFGGLNVYGEPDFQTEAIGNGRTRTVETYTLDPIFVGIYPIEPVVVEVKGSEPVVTPSPAIQVRELTDAEEQAAMQFADITGPVDIEKTLFQRWELWTALAVLAAALVGALVYYLRRGNVVQRLAPPPPSWEIAYARLRELDQKNWPKAGKYQPYYVELSAILRHYIEDRFSLHAPEQTTPEFLAEAAGSGVLSEDHQLLLAHFLRHCDRVKFARFEPTLGDMERSFAEVLRFVDETVPKAEPAEEQAA